MERNIQRNGLINLIVLLLVGVAGFVVAQQSGSQAGQVTAAFVGFGVLIAIVSWFQMRLEERERLEKFELEEMARSKASATLFESKDSELFPAQRAREQFQRYFVPIFTSILFIGEALVAVFLWRWLSKTGVLISEQRALMAAALFGLLALILFLLGRFSVTIARLGDHRLLRPSASYLLLSAYACAAVAIGIGMVKAEFPKADLYIAKALTIVLAVVALETLITLVLEIYRPRVKGKVGRPLYESRLVGLMGQPESLFSAASQALDYQFGFKVSDTWGFRFLKERFFALLLLQLGVLLLSTCFIVIEAGEQGLLERFGKPAGSRALGPGLHLKFPWPVDAVYRYRTEQIQTVNVGFHPEEEGEEKSHGNVVLWTVAHTKEENFIVANRDFSTTTDNVSDTNQNRKIPPVSLLTASIPVQFQVTNITDWVYGHEDGPGLLQQIAEREVVRYLVSADFENVMSRGRLEAGDALRERIQNVANNYKIGVNVLFVGLQDIHPPVKVAPEFEKVVSAVQQRQAKILNAQADAIRTNALSVAQAYILTNMAQIDSLRLSVAALARAAAFTNQIPAFEAAPEVYKQRAYLKTLPVAMANAWKYVNLTTNSDQVIILDLQHKFSDIYGQLTAPMMATPPRTNR